MVEVSNGLKNYLDEFGQLSPEEKAQHRQAFNDQIKGLSFGERLRYEAARCMTLPESRVEAMIGKAWGAVVGMAAADYKPELRLNDDSRLHHHALSAAVARIIHEKDAYFWRVRERLKGKTE